MQESEVTEPSLQFYIWNYHLHSRRNTTEEILEIWVFITSYFYNNANFIKSIRSIKHVDVLYLLALILIFRSICPFSFRVFSTLVTLTSTKNRMCEHFEQKPKFSLQTFEGPFMTPSICDISSRCCMIQIEKEEVNMANQVDR